MAHPNSASFRRRARRSPQLEVTRRTVSYSKTERFSAGKGHFEGKFRSYRRIERTRVVNETSAGGVIIKVHDRQAYVALIARRNRLGKIEWCLPKGHVEKGESRAQAAAREIFEETGISGRVLAPLTTIDYWFSGDGNRIHKHVHHFLLEATGGSLTVENDPDQEAEDAAWVPLLKATEVLVYPNERRVIAVAKALLEIEG